MQKRVDDKEHKVVTGSTRPPGQGGWVYFYCDTCDAEQTWLCAADYPEGFEAWGEAVARFNARHPHTVTLESRWT